MIEIKGRIIKNIVDKPGESASSLKLFKVTENGKNKYFSSEEGYKNWLHNKELRSECVKLMFDIMDYNSNMIMPGRFYKDLSAWGDAYGYEVVKLCMEDCVANNGWILKKEFESEVNKVNYLCAVFRNNLADTMKKWKRIEKQKRDEKKVIKDIPDMDLETVGKNTTKVSDSVNLLGDI